MTTTHHRPTVTARIDTSPTLPGQPITPPPNRGTSTGPSDTYTVTAYMNAAPDHFNGYREGQTVAEATRPDGSPLRLAFTTGRSSSVHEAADAAFIVGNRQGRDDSGQYWPADVRSLSKGDVLRITAPDGSTHHLAIASSGFLTVAPPTEHMHLAATGATSRRAFPWQPGDLVAAGKLIGFLMAQGAVFDHPSGTGATTTLRLRIPDGSLLARPGEWLVHAEGDHWQVVSAHTIANGQPS
ncbi:hypothetical protein OG613_49005 (plasmid) [Streptomyces sp. NBC_00015]|uniref:hypothetical protein n=1 Tax=Streptomyces sp. NBC_00015 TaxID=2903611 RepID=UPI00324D009D